MSMSWTQFVGNPVYQTIANRLYNRHKLRIIDHIDSMSSVGERYGIGINFVARDENLGDFLSRLHPMLPNSRNRYDLSIDPEKQNPLAAGGRFDIVKRDTWRLSIEGRADSEGEWSAGVNFASIPF